MATEKIQVLDIGRKKLESKFKPGEFYNMTTIRDQSNRKISAFGDWADGWKQGDVLELELEKKTYKDKDGFDQVSYSAVNPKKSSKPFFGSSGKNNVVLYSFLAAAYLAPSVLKDKLNLENYLKLQDKIEEEMRKKTNEPKTQDQPASQNKPVREVSVEEPTKISEPEKSSTELSDDDVDINNVDIF